MLKRRVPWWMYAVTAAYVLTFLSTRDKRDGDLRMQDGNPRGPRSESRPCCRGDRWRKQDSGLATSLKR